MGRYQSAVDPSAVEGIDTHVHIQVDSTGHTALPQKVLDAMDAYFGAGDPPLSVAGTASYYRERNLAAVVFTVDATTAMGHAPNSIDELVTQAADQADVLIPFGSVDPLQGARAVEEAQRQAADLGVRGFKFHPTVQNFDPSSEEFTPLFSALEDLGLPIVVHTGQTGVGAGVPGAFGLQLDLSNPMKLDAVAARHPGLTVIMAHPSVPWQDEAISVATHKLNTYIDLSGWAPKYFAPSLIRAAGTYLSDRCLFASDFPAISPDRWLKEFAELPIKDAARPKILKENAVKLLGLGA
jgi:predicted TIM-barrel fold metal-dependent hydrolase